LSISSQANAAKKKSFGTTVPMISPKGGVFASNVTVTLTSALKEIRYTVDGSEPGTNSTLYAAPFLLTNTALIKVRVFESTNGGAGAMESFTFVDTNVAGFNSTLPLLVVDTFGSAIPTATNATHWVKIFNASTNQRATLTNALDFTGAIKLKPRGFTSLRYPKRSLTMELVDAEGEDSPASLLGMPADSDWRLRDRHSPSSPVRASPHVDRPPLSRLHRAQQDLPVGRNGAAGIPRLSDLLQTEHLVGFHLRYRHRARV